MKKDPCNISNTNNNNEVSAASYIVIPTVMKSTTAGTTPTTTATTNGIVTLGGVPKEPPPIESSLVSSSVKLTTTTTTATASSSCSKNILASPPITTTGNGTNNISPSSATATTALLTLATASSKQSDCSSSNNNNTTTRRATNNVFDRLYYNSRCPNNNNNNNTHRHRKEILRNTRPIYTQQKNNNETVRNSNTKRQLGLPSSSSSTCSVTNTSTTIQPPILTTTTTSETTIKNCKEITTAKSAKVAKSIQKKETKIAATQGTSATTTTITRIGRSSGISHLKKTATAFTSHTSNSTNRRNTVNTAAILLQKQPKRSHSKSNTTTTATTTTASSRERRQRNGNVTHECSKRQNRSPEVLPEQEELLVAIAPTDNLLLQHTSKETKVYANLTDCPATMFGGMMINPPTNNTRSRNNTTTNTTNYPMEDCCTSTTIMTLLQDATLDYDSWFQMEEQERNLFLLLERTLISSSLPNDNTNMEGLSSTILWNQHDNTITTQTSGSHLLNDYNNNTSNDDLQQRQLSNEVDTVIRSDEHSIDDSTIHSVVLANNTSAKPSSSWANLREVVQPSSLELMGCFFNNSVIPTPTSNYYSNDEIIRMLSNHAAVSLQRLYRGMKARQIISNALRNASILYSVMVLQKFYKIFISRQRCRATAKTRLDVTASCKTNNNDIQVRASTAIQSRVRQYLQRSLYSKKRVSSIQIQQNFRRFYVVTSKSTLPCSTTKNILFGTNVGQDDDDDDVLVCACSTTTLQPPSSLRLSPPQHDNRFNNNTNNNNMILLTTYVIYIQSLMRQCGMRKQFLNKRKSVTKLQRMVRRCLNTSGCKIKFQDSFATLQRDNDSPVVFTDVICERQQQALAQIMLDACTTIQSYFRCRLAVSIFRRCKCATVKIQCFVRRFIYTRELLKALYAATLIQREARAFVQQKQKSIIQLYTLVTTGAATKIQKAYRRHRFFLSYNESRTIAVTLIQRMLRGFFARMLYTLQRDSIGRIQRNFRCATYQKRQRNRENSLTLMQSQGFVPVTGDGVSLEHIYLLAALQIQSFYRCYFYWHYRKVSLQKCTYLQRWLRSYFAQKAFLTVIRSALKIQLMVRRKKSKRIRNLQMKAKLTEVSLLALYSATKIQCLYRSYCCWHNLFETIKLVVHVQKCLRRFYSLSDLFKKKNLAIKLQRKFHDITLRRNKRILTAFVVIQCAVRRFVYKKRYVESLEAICAIQSFHRCRRIRGFFVHLAHVIVIIQSLVRRYINYMRLYKALRSSVLIVKLSREFLDRKMIRVTATLKACIAAQRVVRRKLCSSQLSKSRRAASLIEKQFRMSLARKSFQAELLSATASASKVQKSFKQYRYRCSLTLKQFSVRKIQSRFRAHRSVHEVCLSRFAAVQVQSAYRCHFAREYFTAVKLISIVIEKEFRRRIAANHFFGLRRATLRVQLWWRRKLKIIYCLRKVSQEAWVLSRTRLRAENTAKLVFLSKTHVSTPQDIQAMAATIFNSELRLQYIRQRKKNIATLIECQFRKDCNYDMNGKHLLHLTKYSPSQRIFADQSDNVEQVLQKKEINGTESIPNLCLTPTSETISSAYFDQIVRNDHGKIVGPKFEQSKKVKTQGEAKLLVPWVRICKDRSNTSFSRPTLKMHVEKISAVPISSVQKKLKEESDQIHTLAHKLRNLVQDGRKQIKAGVLHRPT